MVTSKNKDKTHLEKDILENRDGCLILENSVDDDLTDFFQSTSSTSKKVPVFHFVLSLCLMIVSYFVIITWQKRLPVPLYIKDEYQYRDRFIAERAMRHLVNLTSMGPRPAGSYENEVLAVDFFVRNINTIIGKANKSHKIVLDLQKATGAFSLPFLDGMTNVYRNIQNLVVKIGPGSQHSFLVNCHFDSVADSPGGSDDGASCAIMLEMLRVISKTEQPLKNNIIFLFNGGEENILQASHGFITQHKWAKEVKAFVNLEACGAGGKEILFQAGPEHPWLMELYSQSVPYPLASTMAQEVFQSGLVPGETDYRIFRDFGHISGLDFAWFFNGYVYHTKLDDVHQIPLGTLQRTGDNVLALVMKLTNSHQLSNVDSYKTGNFVLFDFFGTFMIYGREISAALLNISVAIFTLCSIYWNRNDSHSRCIHQKTYMKKICLAAGITVLSWLVALLVSVTVALTVTAVSRALSWYSRQLWIFFLYVIPAFAAQALTVLACSKKLGLTSSQAWLTFRICCDGNNLLYIAVLSVFIILRVRSGFIISIWLFFCTISWFLREIVFPHYKGHRWLWLHTGCLFLPFVFASYIINAVVQLIVPIMGRSGSGNHAEIVFALIFTTILILVFSFFVPIITVTKNVSHFFKGLGALFILSILVLLFTPLGFQYSSDLSSPAPQRYIIVHTSRTFYGFDTSVRKYSSGLWLVDMDVNSPNSVMSIIPEMSQAVPVTDCNEELYCGLPYTVPVMSIMWKTHWIPTAPPSVPKVELKMTYKDYRLHNIRRLSFKATGPDHMTLFLSPVSGVELKGWSFTLGSPLEGPKWNGRSTYFVYYAYGSDPIPWTFWIDLQVPNNHEGPLLDIGLAGHFIHGSHKMTPLLKKFISQFPSWTTTSSWTADYKSYVF